MNCPICGGASGITVTRSDCEGVYRRRKCYECKHIFYTTEYESDGSRLYEIEKERSKMRRVIKNDKARI